MPPRKIVDIGTGSGAIAVTLALETGASVVGTDISPAALRVAAANALGAKVQWLACDLGSALASSSFDLVVSNPPYIAVRDKSTLQREVRDYEPEVALYGGDDGLSIYRRLIPEAKRLLAPNGWLVMEIGHHQSDAVSGIISMTGAWRNIEVQTDLAGLPRVILAQRP